MSRSPHLAEARARVAETMGDLTVARTCCQRAEASLLRARAAWIDAEVEHAAAHQRLHEAHAAAVRASEALTRAQFCNTPPATGDVS